MSRDDFRNINPLEKYHNSVLFQWLVLNQAAALHRRLIGIHHGSDVSSDLHNPPASGSRGAKRDVEE